MVLVRPGDLRTARGGTLVTVGLGSCVAVALLDAEARVGGLCHVLLPAPSGTRMAELVGRYASTAIPDLVRRMVAEGADTGRLAARVVGGASMFPALQSDLVQNVGARNIAGARAVLEEAGIPIRGENVGGSHGRSVYFEVATGTVAVRSVQFPEVVL